MAKFLGVKYIINPLVLVVMVLAALQTSEAQRIYPLRGGTRFESDPTSKKRLVLVAENSNVRISIKRSDKFDPKRGNIWVFWMKIENLSDKPINFDPTKFSVTDDEGRAVAGLEAEVAIKRFNDAIAGVMNMVGNVVAGPLAGPSMVNASERGSTQRLSQQSMQIGEIPPKSFKDGMVFFERSKNKTKEIKANFLGLWSEPIIFTTDESQQPKVDK